MQYESSWKSIRRESSLFLDGMKVAVVFTDYYRYFYDKPEIICWLTHAKNRLVLRCVFIVWMGWTHEFIHCRRRPCGELLCWENLHCMPSSREI